MSAAAMAEDDARTPPTSTNSSPSVSASIVSVQIFDADAYTCAPHSAYEQSFSTFRSKRVQQVPVLRIFGTVPDGRKVCCHVHGALPYLLVEWPRSRPIPSHTDLVRLATDLDAALAASRQTQPAQTAQDASSRANNDAHGGAGSAGSSEATKVGKWRKTPPLVVADIRVVTKLSFYGYHEQPQPFLRIALFNPFLIKRAADLLQEGAVMDIAFQPFEAHVPYFLQFMIDYNLHGMNFLRASTATSRGPPLPETAAAGEGDDQATDSQGYAPAQRRDTDQTAAAPAAAHSSPHPETEQAADEEEARSLKLASHGPNLFWLDWGAEGQQAKPRDVYHQLAFSNIERQSTCALEIDVHASHILNHRRHSAAQGQAGEQTRTDAPANPGLDDIWQDSRARRRQRGQSTQIMSSKEGDRLPLTDELLTANERFHRQRLDELFLPASAGSQASPARASALEDAIAPTPETRRATEGLLDLHSFLDEESLRLSGGSLGRDDLTLMDIEGDTSAAREEAEESLLMSQAWDADVDAISSADKAAASAITMFASPLKRVDGKVIERPSANDGITAEAAHSSVAAVAESSDEDRYKAVHKLDVLHRLAWHSSDSSDDEQDDWGNVARHGDDGHNMAKGDAHATSLLTPKMPKSLQASRRRRRRGHLNLRQHASKLGQDMSRQSSTSPSKPDLIRQALSSASVHAEGDDNQNSDSSPIKPYQGNISAPRNRPASTGRPASATQVSNQEQTPEQTRHLVQVSTMSTTCAHPAIKAGKGAARCFRIKRVPPTVAALDRRASELGIPLQVHTPAHFSSLHDAQEQSAATMLDQRRVNWTPPQPREFDVGLPPFWPGCDDGDDHGGGGGGGVGGVGGGVLGQEKLAGAAHQCRLRRKRWHTFTRPAPRVQLKAHGELKLLGLGEKQKDQQQSDMSSDPGGNDASVGTRDAQPDSSHPSPLGGGKPSLQPSDLYSALDGPARNNTFGFKVATQHASIQASGTARDSLTLLCVEVMAQSRGDKQPDPQQDAVLAIFFTARMEETSPYWRCFANASCWKRSLSADSPLDINGVIVVENEVKGHASPKGQWGMDGCGFGKLNVYPVCSEKSAFLALFELVSSLDPDVLIGYEVQMSSWGYIIERGTALELNPVGNLSRLRLNIASSSLRNNEYAERHTSEVEVEGRVVLNVWRLMRAEIALTSYTFQSLAFHVLHKRLPCYTQRQLLEWYLGRPVCARHRVARYYFERVVGTLDLLQELNLIERTSEFARLFGILFFEVLSRGSQWRVESIMTRIARPRGFVMLSPSRQQVRDQRAPEALPLILEPESKFYHDPVVVLDFQSLYPSMMIAYNICFSTCLGKIPTAQDLARDEEQRLGCYSLHVPAGLLRQLWERDLVHVCPNGVMFVKSSVREGVLPRMLDEILRTRVFVKEDLGAVKGQPALERLLTARQLGLKLIANVTYGYTSATFSGRMPCVDIADAIVQQARETLLRAMTAVNSNPAWDARVVYGDTDSMFVLLRGRTKDAAFAIGREIARELTKANPVPVRLKFEKVYLPCILQTKKRYVGYMYETEAQETPVFDAKGIETVRRDGCPVAAKVLEKSLRLLFETKDLSKIKAYLCRQWTKMQLGHVNLREYVIAKEYRGRESYSDRACVAALEIANRARRHDPRSEPRVRERVPYVIVQGHPKATLISLVRTPDEFLSDDGLMINTTYYIRKQIIPPLERCFNLLGISVALWYDALPKTSRVTAPKLHQGAPVANAQNTIAQYYRSVHCVVCERLTSAGAVCIHCRDSPQATAAALMLNWRDAEHRLQLLRRICGRCAHHTNAGSSPCVSLDCPVFFELQPAMRRASLAQTWARQFDPDC